MHPVLFRWGRFTIRSYPAMLYMGLVVGIVASNAAAHKAAINAFRSYLASCILIVFGLVGARLLHVALHFRFYRRNPHQIWNRSEGGAAQYGSLVLALPASKPLLSALGLPLGAFWDVATFGILVTMIFGRAGCLMHGCCAGRATGSQLGLYLPNHLGVWKKRIPTQIFEAGLAAVLLVLGIVFWHKMPFPGSLFLATTAAYAVARLVLESLRERLFDGRSRFNVFHGLSVALALAALTILTVGWPK